LYPRRDGGVNDEPPDAGRHSPIVPPRWRPDGLGSCPESFPEPPPKSVPNMWTLWKTQDWSVSSLWITSFGRLLDGGSSGRIGGVARGPPVASGTLKTPVQTAWHRSHTIEAPVLNPAVIHSVPGRTGASSSLIHRSTDGTHPERARGARYTSHLVFRLLREHKGTASFPHLWKGLWTKGHNRRSAAITTVSGGIS
jgi:hypothetical protein